MAWAEYERLMLNEWQNLMTSSQRSKEDAFQHFLEANPSMIPGAFSLPLPSGHYPFPQAVISQPILRGLGTKVPDFLWLASDSGTLYPVLIEIENPTKRWFTEKGYPHSDFTQARDQIASWKQWFNQSENKTLFKEMYQIPPSLKGKAFHPIYILVYGSRSELEEKPALNSKRDLMQGQDEHFMTFDRLAPERKAENFVCVRLTESVEGIYYQAKSVPPTFKLGPGSASEHSLIIDMDTAISHNSLIHPKRREFLVSRLPYWKEWSKSNGLRQIDFNAYE